MSDFFARGSVIRRVNGEPAIALGAGRALLLQIAHPVVARGVAEHSNFREKPFARLQATAQAMYGVVFGSTEVVRETGARVRRIHEAVTGPGYRANDVENLLWVHATLCDSAVDAHARFVGALSVRDLRTYYAEMKRVGAIFGLPADAMPPRWDEFRSYFDDTIATMPIAALSRDLAADILSPSLPVVARFPLLPAIAFHRLVAVGSTPRRVREELALHWSNGEQHVLDEIAKASRVLSRVTPRLVRVGPSALAGQLLLAQAKRQGR